MATVYERVRKIVVDQLGVDEEQVVPTTLDLVFAYIPSPGSRRPIHVPTPRAFFNAWP